MNGAAISIKLSIIMMVASALFADQLWMKYFALAILILDGFLAVDGYITSKIHETEERINKW